MSRDFFCIYALFSGFFKKTAGARSDKHAPTGKGYLPYSGIVNSITERTIATWLACASYVFFCPLKADMADTRRMQRIESSGKTWVAVKNWENSV